MAPRTAAQRARTLRRIRFAELMLLSLPIMGDNFLFAAFNLIDSFFLGRLGPYQLSAAGQIATLAFFLVGLALGFSVAVTALVSQAKGRKDREQANKVLGHAMLMLGSAGVILMVALYLFGTNILKLMQVPDEIMPYASAYLFAYAWTLPAGFMRAVLYGALRGSGDSRTILYIHVVGIGLNILLDWLLIFGVWGFPALGVTGAALATSIAVWVEVAILLLIVSKLHTFLRLHRFALDKQVCVRILKVGFPSACGSGLTAFGFLAINGFINTFGPMVSTAYTLASRTVNIFNMPSVGIGQGVAIMVGHALGAHRPKRAERVVRTGAISTLIILIPLMILMFIKAPDFVQIFTNSAEVVKNATPIMRFMAVSTIIFNVYNVILGAFNGGGDTKPVMTFNIIRLWGLRIPLGYVFAFTCGVGFIGFYWSMLISNSIAFIAAYIIYKSGRWQKDLYAEA